MLAQRSKRSFIVKCEFRLRVFAVLELKYNMWCTYTLLANIKSVLESYDRVSGITGKKNPETPADFRYRLEAPIKMSLLPQQRLLFLSHEGHLLYTSFHRE